MYLPNFGCKKEPVVNFDMCLDHLNTSRGLQHMVDRVRNGHVLLQSDIDLAIERRTAIPEKDYQTTALERMVEAIDRVLEFERIIEQKVAHLDPDDWRYTDRKGSEQLRSEVELYERAMDRTARVLGQVSKMAINEKMVSLGKAQTELMVRILMGTISDLGLDLAQMKAAQQYLLDRLRGEANLDARTEDHIAGELTGGVNVGG
jgi:hypothetical protein